MTSGGYYPLTKAQALIHNMDRFLGGSAAVICGSMLLRDNRYTQRLEDAANRLLSMNDALRLRIRINEHGVPEQFLSELAHTHIPMLSFPTKCELHEYGRHWAREPLPLDGPLFQIKIVQTPEQCGLLVKLHHLIGDAWTLSLLGSQINQLLNGEEPQAFSYLDYVQSQQQYLQSKRYEQDRNFFDAQFAKCDEVTYLSEKQTNNYAAARSTYLIAGAEAARILTYTAREGTSPFMLFLTTLAVYISRSKMNAEHFYIGTSVLNRNGMKEKNTAGMFIHTIPLLIGLDNSADFRTNLSEMEDMVLASFRHQKFNYGDTLALLREKHHFKEQLYDVTLSYQNAAILGPQEGIESVWYPCGMQTESLQIHIEDRDREGIFRMHYDYLTDKFTPEQIDKLHQCLTTLLLDAIETNKSPVELSLLPACELQKVLVGFNGTDTDYPTDRCIHVLFEELAEKYPHRAAVKDDEKQMTLRELDDEANRIAGALMDAGVQPGDIIAFALPRKCRMISVMLGILKAGAAYLPIDSAYPAERIKLLLAESRAVYYITDDNAGAMLSHEVPLCLPELNADSPCYGISTSGSTGTPKIVLIRHRNIVNTIFWKINSTPADALTTLCVSASTADTFTEDVLFSLLSGRLLQLCDREKLIDVASLIADNPACAIMTTPTLFNSLFSLLGKEDRLREVTLVGENLSTQFIQKIKDQVDIIYNEYGPSECAVCATRAQVFSDDQEITIGSPISNVRIYIVDRHMQPVPIGTVGELCIAGHGVGIGYLGRDALTNTAFVDNPFGPGKLYKTGDLACWREDGNILYIGRNDFQVKIRGLRIELDEIEHVISSVPGIFESVVVVRKDETGRQVICAFYSEEVPVDVGQIKQAISDKLPRYMLPHIFTKLQALPTTASGKINRKALPEVDLHLISRPEYEAPVGVFEKKMAALWEEVMEYSPAGRNDNFFDVGGDSLRAIEFISRAQAEGIYISLQAVYDHPTIRSLAGYLASSQEKITVRDSGDFSQFQEILSRNTREEKREIQNISLGNVFLAGSTGFLGIHLLAEFLDHDNGTAYCLIRGQSDGQCEDRLGETLEYYFPGKYSEMIGDRVRVLRGDLHMENFGMEPEQYSQLAQQVQTVINAAASVKHYGSYQDFHEANVTTVQRMIDFAFLAEAKMIHASTTSVSGNGFGVAAVPGNVVFSEQNLYIGQSLENVYVRSKFEAEKILLDARLRGLPVHIMRMGNLANRRSDAVFQKNRESNAFLNRMKGILEAGVFPDYLLDTQVEFTPVDDAAAAVMLLARHFDPQFTVFHINNPCLLSMEALLRFFGDCGYPIRIIPEAEFSGILQNAAREATLGQIMTAFVNDMDKDYRLHYENNVQLSNDFTVSRLASLGYHWQAVNATYIRDYIGYFRKNGFFEVSR